MGCFGEGLVRKFGEEPPEEWILAIGGLDSREIARGLRRIVFGWKGGPPNLPDFVRLCRTIGDTDFDPEPQSGPLRPVIEGPAVDDWEITANRHLLAHIIHRRGQFDIEQVEKLVEGKKAWAADMRDLHRNGPVDVELQKACWRDYVESVA